MWLILHLRLWWLLSTDRLYTHSSGNMSPLEALSEHLPRSQQCISTNLCLWVNSWSWPPSCHCNLVMYKLVHWQVHEWSVWMYCVVISYQKLQLNSINNNFIKKKVFLLIWISLFPWFDPLSGKEEISMYTLNNPHTVKAIWVLELFMAAQKARTSLEARKLVLAHGESVCCSLSLSACSSVHTHKIIYMYLD